MLIEIVRTDFTENTSSGQLFIDGERFCETLEDAARAFGVKVPGQTCLPPGNYSVIVTHSPRFNRPMILIYTNPRDHSCEHGGIRFEGVRIHGGNTHEDTEGCPLVAYNRISTDRIQGTAEADLTALVRAALRSGDAVSLTIRNEQRS